MSIQVKSWLLRSNTSHCVFKILASPVPVTPNYNAAEGWAAASASNGCSADDCSADLAAILDYAAQRAIRGLVFFSGDSHMQVSDVM